MRSEARLKWEKVFDRLASSGMSQRAFCAKEGLALSTFAYWRKKFQREEHSGKRGARGSASSAIPFIELSPRVRSERDAAELNGLEIKWPSGVSVRADGRYPSRTLLRIVKAIGAGC